MPIDANDLIEGLDPSVLTSVSGSQLLQMIRDAVPSNTRGMEIYSDDTPDVVTYPRYKRYSWYKPSENNKIHRRWNPNTNTWEVLGATSSSIGTSQIQDGAITLPKLYNPGDASLAYYLLRVNATGTGFELWQLTFNSGSINIDAIIKGANNTFPHVKSDGSAWEFLTADQLAQLISTGVIDISQISTTASGGSIIAKHPSVNKLTALLPGTTGQYLTMVAGFPTWSDFPTLPLSGKGTPAAQNLPAGLGVLSFTHGFTTVPAIVQVRAVCMSTDGGYQVTDEVPIESLYFENGANIEFPVPVSISASEVKVIFTTPSSLAALRKDGTAVFALDRTKWQIKVIAFN